jgi:hypothetical protein
MVTITQIAFAIRKQSPSFIKPSETLTLSHAQQLVAAALGHGSLAAYQASEYETSTFENIAHIVLDGEGLAQRANELKLSIKYSELAIAVAQSIKECLPNVRLHHSVANLDDYVRRLVDKIVVNDGDVAEEMALTNADGLNEIYLPVDDFDFDLLPPNQPIEQEISGHVSMNIDPERPYSGHKIHVQALLTLKRTGEFSIAEPVCTVKKADLDWNWSGDDEEEEDIPRISLAQALANELDIALDEAEELVDSEIITNASSDDLVYSHTFDFSRDASPELTKKLLDKHGSLSLEVPAWFFDRIHASIE